MAHILPRGSQHGQIQQHSWLSWSFPMSSSINFDIVCSCHLLSHVGCQPTLEVLRQILDQRTLMDRKRHIPIDMRDVNIIATATNPGCLGQFAIPVHSFMCLLYLRNHENKLPFSSGTGKACHMMSSRLTRRFFTLNMIHPTESALHVMHGKNILSWLEDFPTYSVNHHYEFSRVSYHKAFSKLVLHGAHSNVPCSDFLSNGLIIKKITALQTTCNWWEAFL